MSPMPDLVKDAGRGAGFFAPIGLALGWLTGSLYYGFRPRREHYRDIAAWAGYTGAGGALLGGILGVTLH